MRIAALITAIALFVPAPAASTDVDAERLFLAANARYENGEYRGALTRYLEAERKGIPSANLYYNIANCYFKMGQLGRAVLYYERSLMIGPRDEDAGYNLAFARSQTVDELNPPSGWEAVSAALMGTKFVTAREVVGIAVALWVFFFLSIAGAALWPGRRYLGYFRSAVATALFVSVIAAGYLSWSERTTERGVVMDAEMKVLNEPSADGGVEFVLHEGTVVEVIRDYDGWLAVSAGEGFQGWVRKDSVEVI